MRRPITSKGPGQLLAIVALSVMMVATSITWASPDPQSSTDNQSNLIRLQPGQTAGHELSADSVQTFSIPLLLNECVHIFVEQDGIDLSLVILNPGKKQLQEIDSLNGLFGPETLSLISEEAGSFFLEVKAGEKGVPSGRYSIRIEQPSQLTQADRDRVAASQVTAEARKLRAGARAERLKSLEKYAEALRLWREIGDREREASTYMAVARVHRLLGDVKSVKENIEAAVKIWADLRNQNGEALALNELGRAYELLGQPELSLEPYQQALSRFETLAHLSDQSITLNFLGNAYNRLADSNRAMAMYKKALEVAETANDRLRQAQALNGYGATLDSNGDRYTALAIYNRALSLLQQSKDTVRIATTLNNLGVLYQKSGEWQSALESFTQALELSKSASKENQVNFRNNIGMLYAILGDYEAALGSYEIALAIHKDITQPSPKIATFSGMGYASAKAGNWEQAKVYYQGALDLLGQGSADLSWKAYTLTNMGVAYAATGNLKTAVDCYEEANKIWDNPKVNEPQGKAYTRDKMARASLASGDFTAASRRFSDALEIWRRIGDQSGEANTLLGLARLDSERNTLAEARKGIDTALQIVEGLRTRSSVEHLRMSYMASRQEFYEFAIKVRMRQHEKDPNNGHDVEALLVSESFRARSLMDTLNNARVDVRQSIDPNLRQRQSRLEMLLAEKEERRRLLGQLDKKEEAASAAKEIVALSATINEMEDRFRSERPHYANLTQPLPIGLGQIQQQVLADDDTLLLEYLLGEEQSYLWVVPRTGKIKSYVLPPRNEIEQKAAAVKCLMTSGGSLGAKTKLSSCGDLDQKHYWAKAAELSDLVLGPIGDRLGKKRLLIVADGELQYLPFGALPAPPSALGKGHDKGQARGSVRGSNAAESNSPLFLRHEIVYLPSASTLALIRREAAGRMEATKTIAIVADPVFEPTDSRVLKNRALASADFTTGQGNGVEGRKNENGAARIDSVDNNTSREDSTLTQLIRPSRTGFARLLSSAQEARAIAALFPPSQRLVATGFAANRTTATSSEITQYRTIHFATHAVIDDQKPELSGIALSSFDQDGRLQPNSFLPLQDIYNLKLAGNLIVLSACNTALGKRVKGEGLISLTRGFMYAGAKTVVSSLWQVDDESTAELMASFYRHMIKDRMKAAAALQAAQSDLWRQAPDRAPYYWGAFIIQGEWR